MLASLMGMVLQCKMVGAEDLTFILHMFGGTNPEKTLPPYELPLNGDTVITSANSLVRLYPTLLRGERYHGWHPPHSVLTTSRVSVRSQLRLNSLYCK